MSVGHAGKDNLNIRYSFISLFYTDPDPCAGAVCRIGHFCHYRNRWTECFCTNPWTGPNCNNYGKIVLILLSEDKTMCLRGPKVMSASNEVISTGSRISFHVSE